MGKLNNVIFTLFLFILTAATQAQNDIVDSTQIQPGDLLYQQIMQQINYGQDAPMAINDTVNLALTNGNTTLDHTTKAMLAADVILAKQFFTKMIEIKSLINVIKTLIELNMDKASQIVELGIALYPDSANEVVDGAALSSNMSLEDIIITAIQSGANLHHISSSANHRTAVEPGPQATPLGIGIGADGSDKNTKRVLNNE
jgi:hypothetical protein